MGYGSTEVLEKKTKKQQQEVIAGFPVSIKNFVKFK